MNCASTSCTADGVSLTRSISNVETDANGIVTSLQVNYMVTNCGGTDLSKLKLQGGLINKSTVLSSPTATGGATNVVYSVNANSASNVMSWTFNLPAGATETFSVYYSVWGVSCGGPLTGAWSLKNCRCFHIVLNLLFPLTGAWSLKNSAGKAIGVSPGDMSATQSGYLDRLYWICQ